MAFFISVRLGIQHCSGGERGHLLLPLCIGVGVGGKEFGMDLRGICGRDGGVGGGGGDLVILDGGNWGGGRGEVIYGMAEEIGTA